MATHLFPIVACPLLRLLAWWLVAQSMKTNFEFSNVSHPHVFTMILSLVKSHSIESLSLGFILTNLYLSLSQQPILSTTTPTLLIIHLLQTPSGDYCLYLLYAILTQA